MLRNGNMLAWIFIYFVLVVLLLAFLLLPAMRAVFIKRTAYLFSASERQVTEWAAVSRNSLQTSSLAAVIAARSSASLLARRKWLVAGVGALLVGPPMLAFNLRRWHVLEFEEDTRDINQQIAALLRGEQLAPPAPLPPDMFVTAEVTMVRPNLLGASRDWGLLDAEFKQRLLLAYRLMKQRHGYEMALLEGYRSPDRQTLLASGDGAAVTNAAAYQSYHQYGLAADSAFYRDGRLVIAEQDPWASRGYQLFGEVVTELKLVWGGNWKLRDYGHVELQRPNVLGR